jgi:hypothetical protein
MVVSVPEARVQTSVAERWLGLRRRQSQRISMLKTLHLTILRVPEARPSLAQRWAKFGRTSAAHNFHHREA